MFGLNFIEILIIGLVVLVLFGNRLPRVMGDLGKGVKAFKDGMENPGEVSKSTKPAPKKKSSSRKGK